MPDLLKVAGFKTIEDLYWKYKCEECIDVSREDFFKLCDAVWDFMVEVDERIKNI